MRKILDRDWKFEEELVTLPHNIHNISYHHSDPSQYTGIYHYTKTIDVPSIYQNQHTFLTFEAIAHQAKVYVDNELVITHQSGYTSFSVPLHTGKNEVKVEVDSSENVNIPPFGNVVDYLAYGGIYRHVYLEIHPESYIEDVFVYSNNAKELSVEVKTVGNGSLSLQILDKDTIIYKTDMSTNTITIKNLQVELWSLDHPKLYTIQVQFGKDTYTTSFGFRTIKFVESGFYLNGNKVFIRGLNRHQSYPYVGYAVADSLQDYDAWYLKYKLGCNAVRTSHYPQSQAFIDACDKYGLLVFTEIPGWQHIGDTSWQDISIQTVKEMVTQYRNHPSIILWGVRINESMDNDKFYTKTNEVVHALDPTRPTSGVRYIKNSQLLEDVYAFNDFTFNGQGQVVQKKKDVMGKDNKPLLISEANGHMFPTKPMDNWPRRTEHALRHAKVLESAMQDHNHIGVFQWCMNDYATHLQFGSGDRICYHGVCDSYRNRKPAGYFYASQSDENPLMYISSSMDIGDYDGGIMDPLVIFTNLDEVKMYINDQYVSSYKADSHSPLPHPPIYVEDWIGDRLEKDTGWSHQKSEDVKYCLNGLRKYGVDHLPVKIKAKLAYCMVRYGLTFQDGADLYGKYIAGWGSSSTTYTFVGMKDGKEVIRKNFSHPKDIHLECHVSKETLFENESYDMALVQIEVKDADGTLCSYDQLPLHLETTGPIEIIGEKDIVLEGGMSGVIVKTTNQSGIATLTMTTKTCDKVFLTWEVKKDVA